ncbi:MAG: phage integrase SAM-like domain and Arm DNA-binding domain-containing protein [Cyclobacteriaceae bacterium]
MRNTNTFGVRFIVRMNKVKEGLAPIYCRITVNGTRKEASLKRWVALSNWNNVIGMATGAHQEIKSLNQYLEEVRSNLVECYKAMHIKKCLITVEAIKNMFLGVEKDESALSKLVEIHNTNLNDILAKGTLKNYKTTQKYLQMFLKKRYRTSDIYLSELSYQFITDLEFLRNHKLTDHQRPLGNNGVMKHMERFRHVSEEELVAMEEKKLDNERLEFARDLFLFS